jgi:hypothetical protein
MSGERVEARSRLVENKPGGVKILGGDRTASALTPLVGVTDRQLEQHLERPALSAGAFPCGVQAGFANAMRVRSSEELWRLVGGENP